MNMIDTYLKMNSCIRDKDDNVYFLDPLDSSKKEFLGKIEKWEIKEGNVSAYIKCVKPIKFININVTIDKE